MSDITRSEAIKQLRLLKADITHGLAFISKTKDKHPALESLDMAIKSLETDEAYDLEYEQPEFCKNCISREQAIDAFPDLLPNIGYNKKVITEILQELPPCNTTRAKKRRMA